MTNTPTLYFLRSSEQYILDKMLPYAYRLDTLGKEASDVEALSIYRDFYGFTNKDLGLYAMLNNEVAGAIWSRRLNHQEAPSISLAVMPKYRKQGIARAMLEQFLSEAGALYDEVQVELIEESSLKELYKKFGFETIEYEGKSLVDGKKTIKLVRKLERAEPVRPSDNYDPRRWMD